MDRIRDIRPPGSPRAEYTDAPRIVGRLLGRAVAGPNSCLIWAGGTDRDNYGRARINNREHRVHRVVYKLLVGPVTEGVLVDHACHNGDVTCPGGRECLHRRCINPHHLEAVTNRENLYRSSLVLPVLNARKTHCLNGHLFDEANTYLDPRGSRTCRECRRARSRVSEARRRAFAKQAVAA